MKGPVAKEELLDVLLQAKCAAKAIGAQRDPLLQLLLHLQPNLPLPVGEGDAHAPAQPSTEDVSSGILGACHPIVDGAKSLAGCLDIAARNGVPSSLPSAAFSAAVEEEKLFDSLLALRLPRHPVTQAHAFARLEAAIYAVFAFMQNIQRCIQHLSNIPDPAHSAAFDHPQEYIAKIIGLDLPDAVAAAAKDLAKITISDPVAAATEDLAKIGLSDPAATATEPTQDSSKIGLSGLAPAGSESGEYLPQETSGSMELDQARTCLDRACTLLSLAVKHVDLAVAAISSSLDPKEVARISDCADAVAIV